MKTFLNQIVMFVTEKRPTFGEIFDLLKTDFTLLNEKVNESEVKQYIEKLVENQNSNFCVDDEFKLLKESSEKGNGFSSYLLGLLYQKGENIHFITIICHLIRKICTAFKKLDHSSFMDTKLVRILRRPSISFANRPALETQLPFAALAFVTSMVAFSWTRS